MVTIINKDRAIIDKLLSEIETKTDREKTAVFADPLELFADLYGIVRSVEALLSEGYKDKDPEILLAAVQYLEDNVKPLLSVINKNDRCLSKTTSMLNKMTQGEYYVEATCRGILGDMSLKRAAEERLRNTAQRILQEKNDKKQEVDSEPSDIEEVSLAPKM